MEGGGGLGSGFLGIFTIIGEILVGSNLIRSGKLLELQTFPQQPQGFQGGYRGGFPGRQPPQRPQEPQEPYADLKQFRQPTKLIPDKAYFCPSCGEKLESVSYDFCMKCGNAIPKPKHPADDDTDLK